MVTLLCAFHGRHACVERIIRCFLNQDYNGQVTLLLYNNSKHEQLLDRIDLPDNKYIILINNHTDLKTKQEYTNVGDIFRDAITFCPDDTDILNFFDSDDIFLPEHVSKGVKGMKTARGLSPLYKAFKPYYSYLLYANHPIELSHNNMEPSIWVDFRYVTEIGFNSVACSYHQKWLTPLQQNDGIFQPILPSPTLIYNWKADHGNHKISGLGDAPENFKMHRKWEQDHGDGILSPSHPKVVQKYYDLIKTNE